MLNTTEKITYRNGFMHNGIPADIETIRPIFDGRRRLPSVCGNSTNGPKHGCVCTT